jgi:hypothetical protein
MPDTRQVFLELYPFSPGLPSFLILAIWLRIQREEKLT